MSKASKIFKSLTPHQQEFIDKKNISANYKIKRWLGFLAKVSHFDAESDKRIKKITGIGTVSFILAFVSLFAAAIAETVLVLIGTAVLVITGIWAFVLRKKLKQKDVNNYLRLFFLPVLNILKDKAGEETKLAASLDFRNPRKALEPQKSKVNGRDLKLYQPTYIIAKVTLLDGTLLEFVVGDDVKDFTWRKTNARGKTKFKSKTKYVHHCFIKMTLPKGEYEYSGREKPGIEIVDHNGHYFAKTKIKIKKVGKEHVLDANAFFSSVQEIYALFKPLNPSEEVRRRTEEEGDDYEGDDEYYYDDYHPGVAYVWYAHSFNDYDYDSFEYSDSGEMIMDDEGATVFDS